MIFRDSIKEQLKNSFEIIIAVALLIFGSILIFSLAADVFGSRIAEVIEDNYGPDGLFNFFTS